MGLFDWLFKFIPAPRGKYGGGFKMLNGYTPTFRRFDGGLYESELIRAAINARATHVSKLAVEIQGAARPALQNKLKRGPNRFQTWGQFLYRLSTLLDIYNTAFITPIYDEYGQVSGIYTPLPDKCEVVQYGGVPYLRYEFGWGDKAAIELENCGIMTKYQHKNDLLGEDNSALISTLDLIHIQEQGIQEGVKSSATYRFMAQVDNWTTPEDMDKERRRFNEYNFSRDAKGKGGLLLFPNTYKNLQQVQSKPFVVDAEQMNLIKSNVFEYFGVNEDVLQNKAFGDAWAAFYEGAIEPFAIQFSDVMTKMLFTFREQAQGNRIYATSNRLQYMTNADKLNVTNGWADRGMATIDEMREVWNLPPLPDGKGQLIPIRGEYYDTQTGERLSTVTIGENENER